MGEDKKADKKSKRIVPKAPVQMIVSREYVGTQTVTRTNRNKNIKLGTSTLKERLDIMSRQKEKR